MDDSRKHAGSKDSNCKMLVPGPKGDDNNFQTTNWAPGSPPPTKCQKQPGDFDMKDFTPQGDVNPVAGGRSAWHVPWMTMETAGATLRREGEGELYSKKWCFS